MSGLSFNIDLTTTEQTQKVIQQTSTSTTTEICIKSTSKSTLLSTSTSKPTSKPKVCLEECEESPIVNKAFKEYGFEEVDYKEDWEIYFSDCQWPENEPVKDVFKNLKPNQIVNYYPEACNTFRKDTMADLISKKYQENPYRFNFSPQSWILPEQLELYKSYCGENPNGCYIAKPNDEQRGEGIFVTSQPEIDIPEDYEGVVQVYINNPSLMEGYKWDMRIYVLIDSLDPLKMYLYDEGLLRLATMKYKKASKLTKASTFMHLTNYSLNKFNDNSKYVLSCESLEPEASHETSILRSVKYFKWWLEQELAVDSAHVWKEIGEVCAKAIEASHEKMLADWKNAGEPNCCQILGFDIMLDEMLKPWFIEINHNPDFLGEEWLCEKINTDMIHEFVQMKKRAREVGVENVGDIGGWTEIRAPK